jgi:formate dehydrogenase major subunit
MVHVTIDGQTLEVPHGTTVLEASKSAGIHIPTLCHFEHLLPYGGCRLCMVEVEGARVLQPSCTLPVFNDMVVRTNTPQIKEAREFILTMLFSERNHFCRYCQVSGGDCELQNAALDEGMDHWPIPPIWEPYPVDASHPYFVLDHNRCILCRRCIRACGELVGNYTLGSAERGAETMVVADNGVPLGESTCIRCGTCISVCPTGALINRQSAYRGRIVDADHTKSICVGCSVGCGIELVTRDNQLLEINGDWDAPANTGLLCELGRFTPIYEERQRLTSPLVRKDGQLKTATWGEALSLIAAQFKPLADQNGVGLAALASTRLSAESLALFKELFVDRLHAGTVASVEEYFTSSAELDRENPDLVGSVEDIKQSDCVFVFGADLFQSHQVAGFFIKRNLPDKTKLIVIDPADNGMDQQALFTLKPKKGGDADLLLGLIAGINTLELSRNKNGYDLDEFTLARVSASTGIAEAEILNACRALGMAEKPVLIYGKGLTGSFTGDSAESIRLLIDLAEMTGAKMISPRGRANSLAAEAYGLANRFSPGGRHAVFVALGDDRISQRQIQLLEEAPFLAVQASYASQLTAMADVVLPVKNWTEQDGHYLNMEGRLQQTHKALLAPEGIRSNVEVLTEIADVLGYKLQTSWETALTPYTISSPALA